VVGCTGPQSVLQAVQQLSQQHLLQLTATSARDSSTSSSSVGDMCGSAWLEFSISAVTSPATATRLAAGCRGSGCGKHAPETLMAVQAK
jgi:hypothetical protein